MRGPSCSRALFGWLNRHLYRCCIQPKSLISPSMGTWSGCSASKEHHPCKNVAKRKGSFSICLIFSALITLFCLSMLIQVLILSAAKVSSGKLAIESFIETHLGGNSNGLDWTVPGYEVNLDTEPDDKQFRENKAFTVSKHFDYWQVVSTSQHRFFVYSAYVDSYNRSNLNRDVLFVSSTDDPDYFVRVIAVTQLTTKEKVICSFQKTDRVSRSIQTQIYREGSLRAIREHWNLKYSAFYVYCPLPRGYHSESSLFKANLSILAFGGSSSTDLSALMRNNAQLLQLIVPSNRLAIHTLAKRETSLDQAKMAVCVKPLHYQYNKPIHLIEFIELNRLLGVEHFYFYNHTIGPEVDHVLRNLSQMKPSLVSILPWLLPVISQKEIRTEGIFAAINDCLYRARMDRFQYVMFIDLDEFIIPHHHTNLHRLITDMSGLYKDQVGAFSFRNAFYYLQYPDDPIDVVQDQERRRIALQLTTLYKTKRKVNLNMHKQRSKCIVVPEYTVEMGNHFVWEMTSGKHTLNVNPNMAYLHHYRVCEFGGDECVRKTEPVTDRRVHLWATKLINRVQQHLQSLCAHRTVLSGSQMCHLLAAQ